MRCLIFILIPFAIFSQDRAFKPVVSVETKVAFVIGNGNYREQPLKNPVNDAKAMSDVLIKLGFKVFLYCDIGQKELKIAIKKFGNEINHGSVGLFYYAGHGIQWNGENYIVPVDAEINREQDIDIEGVRINSVLAEMDAARNKMNIIILDACRNNPFGSGYRSINKGLSQMNAPVGTFIAYATAPGSVATDGDQNNSIFTRELIVEISKPNLPIETVFKHVLSSVKQGTYGAQTPWVASSLEGEFIFNESSIEINSSNIKLEDLPIAMNNVIKDGFIKNSIGIEFVPINAGKCKLEYSSGIKDYSITNPFYISSSKIGKQTWANVMKDGSKSMLNEDSIVDNISWEEAHEFISKLNAIDQTYYYRLPSELEWEYVAHTFEGHDSYINSNGVFGMFVGSKEWCEDWYNPYTFYKSKNRDITGPSRGSYKVIKVTAGHNSKEEELNRNSDYPKSRNYGGIGFRLIAIIKN